MHTYNLNIEFASHEEALAWEKENISHDEGHEMYNGEYVLYISYEDMGDKEILRRVVTV